MSTSDNVSCPSIGISSRRERKKQAKEERDRLKQVEKKKRRLEKALATATAIRIELEKKKQRRREEEKRLDEEGAALAEAVALQVLVEEEIKLLDGTSSEEAGHTENSGPFVGGRAQGAVSPDNTKFQMMSDAYDGGNSGKSLHATSVNTRPNMERKEVTHTEEQVLLAWTIPDNSADNLALSTERAKAAELAAGVAAAQAVAALRIAEEARAEAEAAKKAAEAAISQVLDRRQIPIIEPGQQVAYLPMNIEMERDELKARLEKTERQLKEKTRQVAHLEQSLEDMTHYLFHLKTKLPLPSNSMEKEAETSERGSTNLIQSSWRTSDQ